VVWWRKLGKVITSPGFLLILGILTLLFIGMLLADDYGISLDELKDADYGGLSLEAYRGRRVGWDLYEPVCDLVDGIRALHIAVNIL